MKCLLIQEYDVFAHNLHSEVINFKLYNQYGPSATMLGPYGHHPNRCVYMVPESFKWFPIWVLRGIGQVHEFDDSVAKARGLI